MTTSTRFGTYAAIGFLSATVAAGCGSGKSCTLLGCGSDGVNVEFKQSDAGAYVVDVTVDGVMTTCTATIPLQQAPSDDDPCVAAGIYLMRVGSQQPVAQQSIGGLLIAKSNVTSVGIRISRDGSLLKEASFSPKYDVTPDGVLLRVRARWLLHHAGRPFPSPRHVLAIPSLSGRHRRLDR